VGNFGYRVSNEKIYPFDGKGFTLFTKNYMSKVSSV
jgi:hypothetical protein